MHKRMRVFLLWTFCCMKCYGTGELLNITAAGYQTQQECVAHCSPRDGNYYPVTKYGSCAQDERQNNNRMCQMNRMGMRQMNNDNRMGMCQIKDASRVIGTHILSAKRPPNKMKKAVIARKVVGLLGTASAIISLWIIIMTAVTKHIINRRARSKLKQRKKN